MTRWSDKNPSSQWHYQSKTFEWECQGTVLPCISSRGFSWTCSLSPALGAEALPCRVSIIPTGVLTQKLLLGHSDSSLLICPHCRTVIYFLHLKDITLIFQQPSKFFSQDTVRCNVITFKRKLSLFWLWLQELKPYTLSDPYSLTVLNLANTLRHLYLVQTLN